MYRTGGHLDVVLFDVRLGISLCVLAPLKPKDGFKCATRRSEYGEVYLVPSDRNSVKQFSPRCDRARLSSQRLARSCSRATDQSEASSKLRLSEA